MGLLSYFFKEQPEKAVPKDICYHIEGFLACAYFQEAMSLAEQLDPSSRSSRVQVDVTAHSRKEWSERIKELAKEIPGAQDHRTSPVVWSGCQGQPVSFIGGYDNFMHHVREKHRVGQAKHV